MHSLLDWKCQNAGAEHWIGRASGIVNHVCFRITPKDEGQYLISTNIRAIPDKNCSTLEEAKKESLELLRQYMLNLCIP